MSLRLGGGEGEGGALGQSREARPLLKGAEELSLLVTWVLFAADVDLLIILGHLAALAHALHA